MIRLMNESDIPVVLGFIHETFRQDQYYNPQQQNQLMAYATPESMKKAIAQWHLVVYEDEATHHVFGMAGIDGNHITYLFVDPLAQGMGLGQLLYDYLEKYAMAHHAFGNKKVLTVFSTEKAVSFYDKQGFVEKERVNHVANGQTIVRVKMEKPLDNNL